MGDNQAFIRQKAQQNVVHPGAEKILWSHHAIGKLVMEDLSRQDIEGALITCELIEDYPVQTRPLPDCLVLGWLVGQQPVHAVVAVDESSDRIFIVTVYRPEPRRWEDGYRRRKR